MPYSPFRHTGSILSKRGPIHLTFFVTARCNSHCPFCFYLSDKGKSKDTAAELSLDEIKKISSSIGNLLWLAFSGGEVFLRDDIVEITKVFYERNRPAIILFPTNGLLPDIIRARIEAVLQFCKKSTVVVKLSLEGPEALHDSVRGVKGSFKKVLQTYNALKEFLRVYPNFELGINTVFHSENQDAMEELISFVNGMDGVRTHTISLIRGTVSDKGLKSIDLNKYHSAINLLAANLKKKSSEIYGFKGAKLKAAQDILQRSLIHKTLLTQKQQLPCYAGRLNLVLTETGEVFPCEAFSMNMKMGNVREDNYDLTAIRKGGRAQEILRFIRDRKCFCTHECYLMTNILFNPLKYPALLKEYVQL